MKINSQVCKVIVSNWYFLPKEKCEFIINSEGENIYIYIFLKCNKKFGINRKFNNKEK